MRCKSRVVGSLLRIIDVHEGFKRQGTLRLIVDAGHDADYWGRGVLVKRVAEVNGDGASNGLDFCVW